MFGLLRLPRAAVKGEIYVLFHNKIHCASVLRVRLLFYSASSGVRVFIFVTFHSFSVFLLVGVVFCLLIFTAALSLAVRLPRGALRHFTALLISLL